MKCLIIGYGSIGQRHARILKLMGCDVSVVSAHGTSDYRCYDSVEGAFSSENFDYSIIANNTVEHYPLLISLEQLGFSGPILVEKPVFARVSERRDFRPNIYVGYNLRFHPVMRELRKLICGKLCHTMTIHAGQYLPQWRPGSDYRKSYSASHSSGGGVLMDFSHEMDYVLWITGKWNHLVANGGKLSSLEIESDDVFCIMMSTEKCQSVLMQLDYLDKERRRTIVVNTEEDTIVADLVHGTLSVNGEKMTFEVSRDYTYEEQHRAIIEGRTESLCSVSEGLEVLELVEEARISSEKLEWRIRED
jgi:predicted dehydrogenase